MMRRSFLATCAAAVSGSAFLNLRTVSAAAPEEKPFANLKLRMSAPLDWFPGESHVEKLDGVAAWGLPAYEWLGPHGDLAAIRQKADALGLELSCMVGAGAIAPGWMVQPRDHNKTVEMFEERIVMAKQLGCPRLLGLTGNARQDISMEEQTEHVVACLRRLAPIAAENEVVLALEPLNTLVDHPGFFLTRTDQTVAILDAVNSPNIQIVFDIYHQQITEGNVIRNLTQNIDRIANFHVADNPGRREPGTGELNYTNIFRAISQTNYAGFVALECGHSTGNFEDTLRATLACLV